MVLLALPLALGACDANGPETAAAPPAGSPTPAPKHITVVAPELTDCGTWTVAQGEQLESAAADCLVEAVERRERARLIVTAFSVEGAPVLNSYLVHADGRVTVTIDSSGDPAGAEGLVWQNCGGPVRVIGPLPIFAECSTPRPL
ncbi:hypothetical protein DLE60_20320 [Micromonospora globispora]|uniref:hypothetical protein n=1 Tax=Micromonospora globispora TaxID=1450148 RepID=UPI000D701042|nr:hypothetical protein [Micromonospora globispora]PWU58701.1 hypothetical protein DLE60_20320 [Micromonospora globispora]